MLEILSFPSDFFKQERLIRIYLPEKYVQRNKSYPVLYMHDGQNVFQDKAAIGGVSLSLESYLDKKKIEAIIVGIDQNSEERINEYCPWKGGEYSKKILGETSPLGGKGMQYVDFIVSELKPFIDNNYRTLKDQTSMAGISLGGLISVYAMCRYPHIFRNVAVLSSAFYRNQEEIEQLIKSTDLSLIENVYMDCGAKEAGKDERINKEFLASNRSIYNLLKKKISNAEFEEVKGAEHNYSFFRERVPALLVSLDLAK